jgi:hypothetical protein
MPVIVCISFQFEPLLLVSVGVADFGVTVGCSVGVCIGAVLGAIVGFVVGVCVGLVIVETVAFSAMFGFLALASIAVLLSLRVCFSCFFAFHGFVLCLVAFLCCGGRKLSWFLAGYGLLCYFWPFFAEFFHDSESSALLLLQSCQLKICVINNGTVPTTLSMSAGDCVPLIAQQYLTITWNYASGTVLQPGTSQTITMTINVNQYVTGINTFTNTIYVIATQST